MDVVRIPAVSYLILALTFVMGCAAKRVPEARVSQSAPASAENPSPSQQMAPNIIPNDADAPEKSMDLANAAPIPSDFDLGAGDIVVLTTPDVPELNNYRVRVSNDDVLELPIVGDIDVRGRNERQVRDEIKLHLARFVRDPELDLFVQHYESREVAVLGMVQKPGLYTLNKSTSTVLDAIGRAGGMTTDAAARVILVHSEASESGTEESRLPLENRSSSDGDMGVISSSAAERNSPEGGPAGERLRWNTTGPTVIDLGVPGDQSRLSIPVSPGDTIIVPTAGLVMVKGWVQTAGAYKIVPGMTVFGAVAAAGGEMFSSSVTLIRTGQDGSKETKSLSLKKIARAQEPDIAVLSGDVVVVNRSIVGAVPYLVYALFSKLGTGVYANPF